MLYATRLHALELKRNGGYMWACAQIIPVLVNYRCCSIFNSVFRRSDLLQKDGILKTRERGKKHHEERRKILRPAKNLPGLQRKRRFPL